MSSWYPWDDREISPEAARALQREPAKSVRARDEVESLRFIAGVDCAYREDHCLAAAVVWDLRDGTVVEESSAAVPLRFLYLPGLLSFRELPGAVAALGALGQRYDGVICDGHGYAHPRRFGLACHLGVALETPSIGCAKSLLVGDYELPAEARGSRSEIVDHGETVGVALRTAGGVRPVFVSVGHMVTLDRACSVVLECATRYRLPEPTRLADRLLRR
jgi:deoxyribonuclease V